MADPLIVRACTPNDVVDVCDVINDGAVAYRGVIPADCWHEPYMPREELDAEIAAGVAFSGACDATGRLLGVMGLQHVSDVALIRHAYTRTAAQGRGVGSALLEHLGRRTDRRLLVGTWKAAVWAIRFYEHRGFELVDDVEKTALLQRYWTVPPRQIETSVVLVSRRAGA